MKSTFSWPVALVAVATIAGVVTLAALGKDAAVLVSLVSMGLSALLYGKVQGVESNTNGNTTNQLRIIQEALRVLAVTQPASSTSAVVEVLPPDPAPSAASPPGWPQQPETD